VTLHANRVIQLALTALLLSAAVKPAMACSCKGESSPCWEIGVGNAAFTGKVISVSPAFLNRYNRSSRSDVDRIIEFYNQLKSGAAGGNLPALKETLRPFFGKHGSDLPFRSAVYAGAAQWASQ
jgi:hypothetical protein